MQHSEFYFCYLWWPECLGKWRIFFFLSRRCIYLQAHFLYNSSKFLLQELLAFIFCASSDKDNEYTVHDMGMFLLNYQYLYSVGEKLHLFAVYCCWWWLYTPICLTCLVESNSFDRMSCTWYEHRALSSFFSQKFFFIKCFIRPVISENFLASILIKTFTPITFFFLQNSFIVSLGEKLNTL